MQSSYTAFAIIVAVLGVVASSLGQDESADTEAAKAAATQYLASAAMGDSVSLDEVAFNSDLYLTRAWEDFVESGREVDEAARKKFPDPNQAKPAAPKTAEEIATSLRSMQVRVTGDSAVATPGPGAPSSETIILKRTGGRWKVDASKLVPATATPQREQALVVSLGDGASVNREFARNLPNSTYPDWPTAKADLAAKTRAALAADDVYQGLIHQAPPSQPRSAPAPSPARAPFPPVTVAPPSGEQLTDYAAARDAAIRYLVAGATGDAATMKSVTIGGDPELFDALAEYITAGRKIDAQARAKFGNADPIQPFSDSSPAQLTAKLQYVTVQMDGDKAKSNVGGNTAHTARIMLLQRVNGRWFVVANSVLSHKDVGRNDPVVIGTRIKAAMRRQLADEISQGRYTDWEAAKTSLARKIQFALATNIVYQDALRAQANAPIPDHVQDQPPAAVPKPELPDRPQDAASDIPSGAAKTEMVGGQGGSPFVHVESLQTHVMGFRYSLGHWGNRQVIRQFDPVFPDTPEDTNKRVKLINAREGYIVGGLIVDTDGTNAVAIRVIFFRSKDGKPDPSARYLSDWIGTPSGLSQKTLGGHGEGIVGTFGHKGLNLDAIGLLFAPAN